MLCTPQVYSLPNEPVAVRRDIQHRMNRDAACQRAVDVSDDADGGIVSAVNALVPMCSPYGPSCTIAGTVALVALAAGMAFALPNLSR